MPTVSVYVNGSGNVRVSQKLPSQTSYNLLGVATSSQNGTMQNDFSFGFWDNALFSASPDNGYQFVKYCADSNQDGITTCGTQSMLTTEVDKNYDVLQAYFSPFPLPPQPPPQSDFFMWLWNWFWGRN